MLGVFRSRAIPKFCKGVHQFGEPISMTFAPPLDGLVSGMLEANRRELPANPGGASALIEINAAVQRTMLWAVGQGCSRRTNSNNPNSTNLNEEVIQEQEETKNGRNLSRHCGGGAFVRSSPSQGGTSTRKKTDSTNAARRGRRYERRRG